MKRTLSILTLAAVVGLILGSQARAAAPAHSLAVQAAAHAVAHHPGRGHHRHQPQYRHYGRSHRSYLHHPPLYNPRRAPVVVPAYPPVIVAPPVGYYAPYYGRQGGVMIQGRGWGVGFGF